MIMGWFSELNNSTDGTFDRVDNTEGQRMLCKITHPWINICWWEVVETEKEHARPAGKTSVDI